MEDSVAVSVDDHVEGSGDGRRRVDDDQIAGFEVIGQGGKRRVDRRGRPR